MLLTNFAAVGQFLQQFILSFFYLTLNLFVEHASKILVLNRKVPLINGATSQENLNIHLALKTLYLSMMLRMSSMQGNGYASNRVKQLMAWL